MTRPNPGFPIALAGLLTLSPFAALRAQDAAPAATAVVQPAKAKKKTRKKARPTPTVPSPTPVPAADATPSATVASPTPVPATEAMGPGEWSKEWMTKYVIPTPKTDYIHVLLDAETVFQRLEGASNHAAVAAEAWSLLQHFTFPADGADLVKMDVVHFKERDSYGQPKWDTLERIGHLEFSRKALSQSSPDALSKPEAEWKSLFSVVNFYE